MSISIARRARLCFCSVKRKGGAQSDVRPSFRRRAENVFFESEIYVSSLTEHGSGIRESIKGNRGRCLVRGTCWSEIKKKPGKL